MTTDIILASRSVRRKLLLEWANVNFEIIVKDTDEVVPPGATVQEAVVAIAGQKAAAAQEYISYAYHTEHRRKPLVAADTVVVLEDKIIGKPTNPAEAMQMLRDLSCKMHKVVTGVVIKQGDKQVAFHDTSEVLFHPISEEKINYYVETYKPYDKSGAYGIQEWIGVIALKSINGDFYNVMGLPVSRVLQTLEQHFDFKFRF